MKPIDRRTFLAGSAAAALFTSVDMPAAGASEKLKPESGHINVLQSAFNATVDFRFAPEDFQSTICFPDDPAKTVVGKHGDFRYDFPFDPFAAINQFGTIVEFTLAGMHRDTWVEQKMEAPGIPILHTVIDRPTARLELIAFASRRQNEGRVDNLLMEISARNEDVVVTPLVRIRSDRKYDLKSKNSIVTEVVRESAEQPWMFCIPQNNQAHDITWLREEGGYRLTLEHGTATRNRPLRYLFRMPQAGSANTVDTSVDPDSLLSEVRSWWQEWRGFAGRVQWSVPAPKGDFLTACAQNIQQAREMKDGKLVFEVGPTVYRGLWVVDGNFLLEAARYLGYDEEADQGLLSEWRRQVDTGQIIASGGKEHWKDTAIAMFTLVRACELKQDWDLMRQLAPNVGHAIDFLIGLRDEARKGHSPNGRYGLIAPGFPDGGIAGVRYDFTNTVWTLAGLRAVVKANEKLRLSDLDRATTFYKELQSAFDVAAREEMVQDPRGFAYLPMLMREDTE
ncbi:MAG: hypothetical protein WAK26_02530, partial [Terracidiphilus sp.]